MSRTEKHQLKNSQQPNYDAADTLMGIFGYKRVEDDKLSRIRQEAEISDLEETNLYKTICE